MPITIEETCWKALFTMTTTFGGIVSQAKRHNTWEKGLLTFMGSKVVGLEDNCALSDVCDDYATALAAALGKVLAEDAVDPEQVDAQIADIGQNLSNLVTCLFDMYALAPETALEMVGRPFTAWPEDDWMMEIFPLRHHKTAVR